MSSRKQTIAILGAGPAGLGLALRLLRRPSLRANVVVLEKADRVGGLTASFEYHGIHFDYGSHRLHPATSPQILDDVLALLRGDLLDRPRNGRILLQGRFVRFPLQPWDLVRHLPPSFTLGFARDLLLGPVRKRVKRPDVTFADALLRGLGPTMCRNFYFPYARKVWGLEPEQIDAVQAQRRVAANDTAKLLRKALSLVPGFRRPGTGRFFYPRRGFGQICTAMAEEVKRRGGTIVLNASVAGLKRAPDGSIEVQAAEAQNPRHVLPTVDADFVFSTIPLTTLVSLLQPEVPQEVRQAAERLRYQGMVFVYLLLRAEHFSPFDAHYLPGQEVIASRLSEPKNYSGATEPEGITGLCAEIPCSVDTLLWQMSDQELTSRVLYELEHAGLKVRFPVLASFSRRVTHAYPVYHVGFQGPLRAVEGYLATVPTVVSLGRQGLFAHDNTHHTLEMAYRAAECLDDDLRWDAQTWQRHREVFARHVVED